MNTTINLLPWREKQREKNKRVYIKALVVYGLIFLAIAVGIQWYLSSQVARQVRHNQQLQRRIDHLNTRSARLRKKTAQLPKTVQEIKILHALANARYVAIKLFNEIAAIVPKDVYLSKMQRKNGQVILFGEASTNEAVAELLRRIKYSSRLKQSILHEVNMQRKKTAHHVQFRLLFRIDEPLQVFNLNGQQENKK